MTHYKLDVSKWKSGPGNNKFTTGTGSTCMLNEKGYMCCLGQFAKQKGVSDDHLLDKGDPSDVYHSIQKRYDQAFVHKGKVTKLAKKLIDINDSMREYKKFTPKQRADAIRAELKKHGHTLTVIGYKDLK